jgi:hypothetical protein
LSYICFYYFAGLSKENYEFVVIKKIKLIEMARDYLCCGQEEIILVKVNASVIKIFETLPEEKWENGRLDSYSPTNGSCC